MIRCRRCDQWCVTTSHRTSTLVIIDGVPSCQHFGLRVATADEVAANDCHPNGA